MEHMFVFYMRLDRDITNPHREIRVTPLHLPGTSAGARLPPTRPFATTDTVHILSNGLAGLWGGRYGDSD